ncbi:MAG: ATP-binding protein [Synechococcus sp.]|nr:ATP-binding protein [Synechococcus sp.]
MIQYFKDFKKINLKPIKINQQKLRFYDVLILLFLILASYLGNYFPVNLFFGISFLFGSIGAWIALYLYGPLWGIVTAAIASLHTAVLWNHPYAIIIFTVEALFVIYCWGKKQDSIVFYDALYWLILGIPLVLFFYKIPLGMSLQAAFAVALKQAGNGVFNALIASLLFICIPFKKIPGIRLRYRSSKALQQVIFDVLLAFIIVPVFALMVLSAHERFFKMQQDMDLTLSLPAKVITQELINLEKDYTQASEIVANLIRLDPDLSGNTTSAIQNVLSIYPEIKSITLFNPDGNFVESFSVAEGLDVPETNVDNSLKIKKLEDLLKEYTFDNQLTLEIRKVPIPREIQEGFNLNGILFSLREPGYLLTEINLEIVKNILDENFDKVSPQTLRGVFINHRNNQILFDTLNEQPQGTVWEQESTHKIQPLLGETAIALPIASFGKSAMTIWEEAFAFQVLPLRQASLEADLWLILTVKPYIQSLSQFYTYSLLIVWLLILGAIATATAVSKWLTRPLNQLSQMTTNVHKRLHTEEIIRLPQHQILELDRLSHNFQVMLSTLQQQFRTIQDNADNLETLVTDRTQALLQEINERRRIETELRQSKEIAEQANRAKSNFLATMSHELRTPLNSVLGLAESLEEEIYGPVTPKQQEILQVIEKSGAHLLELINDILDIAKVENKHIEFEFAPTNVVTVCDDALSFVQELAARKQITLHRDIPFDALPLTVDKRRLLQALINLLNNALKFTYDGGNVTLKAELQNHQALQQKESNVDSASPQFLGDKSVILGAGSTQGLLCLSVIDTGIGIQRSDLSKIFEPFTQIDSALNRRYDGTGLGLALVQNIVNAHHGEVGVSSTPGKGSCFWIKLPCDAQDQNPKVPMEFSQ